MSDATTLTRDASPEAADAGPTIRPRRSLPGGRAVVGAFLVVVAAVGTFGAYLQATAAPTSVFMVAERDLPIGHEVTEADLAGGQAAFRGVAVDLPEEQAARAIGDTTANAEQLLGTVLVAPVSAGDLLQRSQFVDVGASTGGVVMSFSVPLDRALGGNVGAGERVDLIATYTVDGGSETRVVARDVTVIGGADSSDAIGGGRMMLTVELPDLATAQRLQHAVDTAQVAVLRGGDPGVPAPPPSTGDSPPSAPAGTATDTTEQG